MNFMVDDEFLILMNINPALDPLMDTIPALPLDARKKLREVGLKTALEYPNWIRINPAPHEFDFMEVNEFLSMNRSADMKTIFPVTNWNIPEWVEDDWYAKHRDGSINRTVLSIWNEEAQEYTDYYCKKLISNFGARDVLFYWGDWQGGEGIYPAEQCFYDRCALEDYRANYGSTATPDITTQETLDWYGKKIIEHSLRKQRIFYPQHKEIWNAQQYLMETWTKAFGNFVIPETFQAFRDEFPELSLVFLQYTYYDDAHYKIPNEEFVKKMQADYNCEVIVEAHFAQGLKTTTPRAIIDGFRGQVCGLIHFQSGKFAFEDWMVEEVGKSITLWKDMTWNENNNNS